MKRVFIFALIAVLAGCGSSNSVEQAASPKKAEVADVQVSQKTEFYEISGSTGSELREQMNQKGIPWNDGKTYDALTSWTINWEYAFDCSTTGCVIGSFSTNVEITFRYPKWIQAADGPSSLVSEWNRYMDNLIVHENGHRDMAVTAASELTLAAYSLPSAPDTFALEQKLAALTTQRTAELNADQINYDQTTAHGALQGALFP